MPGRDASLWLAEAGRANRLCADVAAMLWDGADERVVYRHGLQALAVADVAVANLKLLLGRGGLEDQRQQIQSWVSVLGYQSEYLTRHLSALVAQPRERLALDVRAATRGDQEQRDDPSSALYTRLVERRFAARG